MTLPPCLIAGGAACVWADAEAAFALIDEAHVFAVKHVASVWPGPITALISLHPEKLGATFKARQRRGLDMDFKVWTHKRSSDRGRASGRIDCVLPAADWGGSSGLFAVQVARHIGYEKIILAGVPIDDSAHFNDPAPLERPARYRQAWLAHRAEIAPYVRSVSGWTSEILGKPDIAWLKSDPLTPEPSAENRSPRSGA
jgi:hypothetical protein